MPIVDPIAREVVAAADRPQADPVSMLAFLRMLKKCVNRHCDYHSIPCSTHRVPVPGQEPADALARLPAVAVAPPGCGLKRRAMAMLHFEGRDYPVAEGDTVLDTLLRGGANVPFSCRKGICQGCVMRSASEPVPREAQGELKATLRADNCFLSCVWKASADGCIERVAAGKLFAPATVVAVEPCGVDMCRVLLDTSTALFYHPGQFVNVRGPMGLVRSYALASVPAREPVLELHVKRRRNGIVSGWMHDVLEAGDSVEFDGPHGRCHYVPGAPEQPLLLVGTGCGAAALWGIARDALHAGHHGPIHVYLGSGSYDGLYLHRAFAALAAEHPQLRYTGCTSCEDTSVTQAGRADAIALSAHPRLDGWRVFACGHPGMVAGLQAHAADAGAAIHVTPFELTDLRRQAR